MDFQQHRRAGRRSRERELVTALQAMVEAFRPFKLRPVGCRNSRARATQDAQIRAHAAALAALAKAAISQETPQ